MKKDCKQKKFTSTSGRKLQLLTKINGALVSID